jgi:acyl-phosphate glycerol 3-phosphate acyltransferase
VSTATVLELLGAMVVAYFLGAIPVAGLVSRYRHVDIFSAGTRQAGAANVFRTVGHLEGVAVFFGDAAKGALAVLAAYGLGLDGQLVLVPALAALAGHWRSVFVHFRGGDGLSTMVGITLAIFPEATLLSLVPASSVAVLARVTGHHPSLWGGAAGSGFIVGRSIFFDDSLALLLGVVLLALLVLAHAVYSHHAAPA